MSLQFKVYLSPRIIRFADDSLMLYEGPNMAKADAAHRSATKWAKENSMPLTVEIEINGVKQVGRQVKG